MYFAVPLTGSSDTFSGQYLRLEQYIGTKEDRHLPASISRTTLNGIALSSTGYFILNSMAGVIETFGKALTEKIVGGDHKVTIEKGDWTLKVENGAISISATNTGTVSAMSFKSTGSDVYFDALKGTSKTKDRWNVKTSTSNAVSFVAGFEFSAVAGLSNKENKGFILSVNVIGSVSIKALEVKVEAFPMKVNLLQNVGTFFMQLKFQGLSWAWRKIDHKTVLLYQKISFIQIYKELDADESTAMQDEAKNVNMRSAIAKSRESALDVSMGRLIKF